jgi:tetratricopeptide (TPR) repeat protein
MLRSMSANATVIADRITEAERHRAAGDFPAAMRILGALFESHPADGAVVLALARTGAAMGGKSEALALIEFALQSGLSGLDLWLERAAMLEQIDRADEAESGLCDLVREGGDPTPLLRLGYLQRRLGAYDRARASTRALTAAYPTLAHGWTSLAIGLYTHGDLAGAEACFDRALLLNASDPLAQFSRALCLLAAGRWREGFPGFACRRRLPNAVAAPAGLPERQGGERRLLVWNDQALGDAIQFLRYVPLLRRRGMETALLLPHSLVRLARTVPDIGPVVSPDDPLPPAEAHLPMMDVPALLDLDDIPATVPYVQADREASARWRERLGSLPGLKVGLVWAGDSRITNFQMNALDRRRSLTADELAPLLAVEGASFVSLQLGASPQSLPGAVDAMGEVTDFADTASVIDALDLVITVDTSVAHLAGALGKPVWILSRYDGCWRWLRDRADTPWYPSARLFRQAEPRRWAPVIGEIAASLGELIAARL